MQRHGRGGRPLAVPSSPQQLDLAALLESGAAALLRADPSLARSPAVIDRLRRLLGAPLPCQAVIRWRCPRCGARTRADLRCGPECPHCRRGRRPRVATMLRQVPAAPVRHWVLTLPRPQRAALAGDPRSEARLARSFVQAIFARLRARAGRRDAECGALAVIHRSGSALDLNLHIHAIVLDGVLERDASEARVLPVTLDDDDLAAILRATDGALKRCPRSVAVEAPLARVRGRAGQTLRLGSGRSTGEIAGAAAAAAGGLRVFRGEAIGADDRGRLRRLCGYLVRPPTERLVVDAVAPAAVTIRLPSIAEGGAQATLSTAELASRLLAAMPSGPAISTRTFGALAPRAAHLWQTTRGQQLPLAACASDGDRERPRRRGARPPSCPRCAAPMRALEVEDSADPAVPSAAGLEGASGRRAAGERTRDAPPARRAMLRRAALPSRGRREGAGDERGERRAAVPARPWAASTRLSRQGPRRRCGP